MPTIIRHIRHPFDQDAEHKLATLLSHLAEQTLEPTFEEYGDFMSECEPSWWEALGDEVAGMDRRLAVHVWGNFHTLSAVFDLITDDEAVIAALALAIRANKSTVAYKEARDARIAYKAEVAAKVAAREAKDREFAEYQEARRRFGV